MHSASIQMNPCKDVRGIIAKASLRFGESRNKMPLHMISSEAGLVFSKVGISGSWQGGPQVYDSARYSGGLFKL